MGYPSGPNGLSFRIAIDGAMIIMMAFLAGTGWKSLDNLQTQIDRGQVAPERIARLEEKIDYLIREVNRLQSRDDKRP